VAFALRGETAATVDLGMIESDAVAISCRTTETALSIGRRLFRAAFEQTSKNHDHRSWLRGVVVSRDTDEPLRRSAKFKQALKIDLMLYSQELLDAIATEKSGFKGMRLLIAEDLITPELRRSVRLPAGDLWLVPLRHLRHCNYPGRVAVGFRDYLWMAPQPDSADNKAAYDILMATRLRLAAGDPEEFIQAAATQVLFHEYSAILSSLLGRDNHLKRQAASAVD
jgi:hypothetical protein